MMQLIVKTGPGAGQAFELAGGSMTIGREEDNAIVIGHESVSRHHASLTWSETGWLLRDHGSTNGTQVNGRLATERTLQPGDVLTFGDVEAMLRETLEAPPPAAIARGGNSSRNTLRLTTAAILALGMLALAATTLLRLPHPRPETAAMTKPPIPVPAPPEHNNKISDNSEPPASNQPLADNARPLAAPVTTLPAAITKPRALAASVPPPAPPSPPVPELRVLEDKVVYQKAPGLSEPVFSPDLRHVLWYRQSLPLKTNDPENSGVPADEAVDLYLDGQVVTTLGHIDTAADLHFSADSSAWLVKARDHDSQLPVLVQGLRAFRLSGPLLAWAGSDNFNTVAMIVDLGSSAQLFINGRLDATEERLQDLHLSADGRHWACVASNTESLARTPPGEKPKTSQWVIADGVPQPCYDTVAGLAISSKGGRFAYIGLHGVTNGGTSTLILNGARAGQWPVVEPPPSGLAFSASGDRFGCHKRTMTGEVVFIIDGSPVHIRHGIQGGEATRASPVLFSEDGRHAIFAMTVGTQALVWHDGNEIAITGDLDLSSFVLMPDGRPAFITSQDVVPSKLRLNGTTIRQRETTLWAGFQKVRSIPTLQLAHPPLGDFIIGGFHHVQLASGAHDLAGFETAFTSPRKPSSERLWVGTRELAQPGITAARLVDMKSQEDGGMRVLVRDESGNVRVLVITVRAKGIAPHM